MTGISTGNPHRDNMSITFLKRINAYSANIHGKQFVYSVSKYGEEALKLAELSMIDEKRHNHVFEIKDNFAIMRIYHSVTRKVYPVFLDKDDISKVSPFKWYILVPENAKTLYVANDKLGKLHRYLLDLKNAPSLIVDHINRNGLDNRKENLRVVSPSINARNKSLLLNNKIGHNGIHFEKANGCHSSRYRAVWIDDKGNDHSKSFSLSKYKNALSLAINYREEMEKKYGYL